jgi:hypothetical protein
MAVLHSFLVLVNDSRHGRFEATLTQDCVRQSSRVKNNGCGLEKQLASEIRHLHQDCQAKKEKLRITFIAP